MFLNRHPYFERIVASLFLIAYTPLVAFPFGTHFGLRVERASVLTPRKKDTIRDLEPVLPFLKKKPSPQISTAVNKPEPKQEQAIVYQSGKRFKKYIGGPSQPEMASFKAVGTDNMVNLFTGDFNYNIPLLDVGGYPVNIFYDGSISMEQEASWVGLGWNINPGTITRNMRGIPDDFNGTEKLTQTQKIKPNVTWGITASADVELVGLGILKAFSGSVGVSQGFTFNNYLGPSLEFGISGNTGLNIGGKAESEKKAGKISAGLGINLSSRSGLSFSPSVSLTANTFDQNRKTSFGIGLSTSYNSRSGIKELQLSEQMTASKKEENASDYKSSVGETLLSNSISFAKPSYIPSLRLPQTNSAYSGRFKLGFGLFGGYGSGAVEVYKQKTEIADADVTQTKPIVGYLYYQNAKDRSDVVMDFSRLNDNEVSENTPLISAPQYSYDVFTIQGEGTGGSVRAYRNDLGYMRDNYTRSQDKSFGLGGDIGGGHYGANFNIVKTPTTIGEWNDGNQLKNAVGFTNPSTSFENVYFRNPGETSVLNPNQYDKIGGTDLVTFKLSGSGVNPYLTPTLKRFDKAGYFKSDLNITSVAAGTQRKKRTQVFSFLTAAEAKQVGLDKTIKNYYQDVLTSEKLLHYQDIDRINDDRRAHHISQINVTEANGKRYIYGLPVYNVKQKDFTFSVGSPASPNVEQVSYNADHPTTGSEFFGNGLKDGYVQITENPAYAHSFLLTGLLSPDYVDITGNGVTEDDQGSAIKFNYSKMDNYKWRTPLGNKMANFNAGKRTETKDDKGIVSYGERESWYLQSIESKNMIAVFTLDDRQDGKGVLSEEGGINTGDHSRKRLQKIDLYSKPDVKKNGIGVGSTYAKPIKTVHFEYNYSLCQGIPDNPSTTTGEKGKLTLTGIYFSYNGQSRASKNKYLFSYTKTVGTQETGNPVYEINAADRWGTYKSKSDNPDAMKNSDYPYTLQDAASENTLKQNAGAWSLKKILLPSGGEMDIEYESDDYAFVQNRKAANMMVIDGFGSTSSVDYKNASNSEGKNLFQINGSTIVNNNFVFIKVPVACSSPADVYRLYLEGQSQFAFKLAVNMPKTKNGETEYITTYAELSTSNSYGVYTSDQTGKTIWFQLREVDGVSPLSLSAIEFLRQQLPGQAFTGQDVSESSGLKQVGDMLVGMWNSLKNAFGNPVNYLRTEGKAQTVELKHSFVRLNDPDGIKYGGGHRVRSITLKDNWKKMNNDQSYTSVYGQEYSYKTTAIVNGVSKEISSGVASYEPSLGGEENPFHTVIQLSNKLPLGPASYGSIEMPILDGFFPAPSVGYSKVTVRSLKQDYGTAGYKSRSGIGKQVTEFYTAKDFPVYYSNTWLDPTTDKQEHQSSGTAFFYKYAFDSRAISQGFLIETNDMHGKMKSQASYPENDENTPFSYTENFYRNTGSKGMDEKFLFVDGSQQGVISEGNMGVDVELMTDAREFNVQTKSLEIQGQVDLFPVFFPIWLPFIWPTVGKTESKYRAATTTKVISYHSIVDSVLVIDKGSRVTTKNLLFDAETGEIVLNRTNNEFDEPIYNTSYPAYWAYSGMGLAYKNIDVSLKGVNFYNGEITNQSGVSNLFESGDEVYLSNTGTSISGTCSNLLSADPSVTKLWAINTNKANGPLTDPAPHIIFIDHNGRPFTRNSVDLRIIRSGHRNMLDGKLSAVTSMASPIVEESANNFKLKITDDTKVISASALQFDENWKMDPDFFYKKLDLICIVDDSKALFNPYVKGLLGNFKSKGERIFYGSREQGRSTVTQATNLSKNGYLDEFAQFWDWEFNSPHLLKPDESNSKWVVKEVATKINSKGLQLETKNALDIYTSAQYGMNRSMPVAITSNSPYASMAAEGFEDYFYDGSLSSVSTNTVTVPNILCGSRHIDFSDLMQANSMQLVSSSGSFAAHTGKYAVKIDGSSASKSFPVSSGPESSYTIGDYSTQNDAATGCTYRKPLLFTGGMINPTFTVPLEVKMYFSCWVKETCGSADGNPPCNEKTYVNSRVEIEAGGNTVTLLPSGSIIEGWQRIEGTFTAPVGATSTGVKLSFLNNTGESIYIDDVRLHPFNANMKAYVYDPVTLRLAAELDANNFGVFYEYDEEGTLLRTKAETKEGIKTLTETRSAIQSKIKSF